MGQKRDVIFAGWQNQTPREDVNRTEYTNSVGIKVKNSVWIQ